MMDAFLKNTKLKLRHITLPNGSLSAHPKAQKALKAWLKLSPTSSLNRLVSQKLPELGLLLPQISLVKKEDDSFYFFTGFERYEAIIKRNEPYKNICFEFDKIFEDEIEIAAWGEVIKLSFTDASGWLLYREVINKHMPKELIRIFFNKSQVSFSALAALTGIPLSTLKRLESKRKDGNS